MTTLADQMNRIYFNLIDTAALATWLEAQPPGTWHVLIGTDIQEITMTNAVASIAVDCGKDTVRWITDKIQHGQLVIRVSPVLDIPSGVPLPNARNGDL